MGGTETKFQKRAALILQGTLKTTPRQPSIIIIGSLYLSNTCSDWRWVVSYVCSSECERKREEKTELTDTELGIQGRKTKRGPG